MAQSLAVPAGSCPNRARRFVWHTACWLLCTILLAVAGCDGIQSTLAPAGRGAEQIAELFAWMAGGAVIIWTLVFGLTLYAFLIRPQRHDRGAALLVIGGGAVFPTVVLGVLVAYGLSILPGLLAPAPEGSLAITVTGHQWWWRVRYAGAEGETIELANEIRLPVGESADFLLDSPDVIHSFWVPSLGGKMDMVPGRVTRLTLHPTRTGVFRGACAEYCGTSHALMNFYVVVVERDDFDRWLARQAASAEPPRGPLRERGQQVFLSNGCGACHTVRGTAADGEIGPDLTHVGSRLSVGAGILENEAEQLLRWVARTEDVKPGVHMPAFGMLPAEDLRALSIYLDGLR